MHVDEVKNVHQNVANGRLSFLPTLMGKGNISTDVWVDDSPGE